MAKRPVFMPTAKGSALVLERWIDFRWHAGMAPSQGKRNVDEMHSQAFLEGLSPLLEVSTRSELSIGQRLSAFSLKVEIDGDRWPFESLYHSAKVFAYGGPFEDIRFFEPRAAKADPRLKSSGPLVGFALQGKIYEMNPPTAFFDWLYCLALLPHAEFLRERLAKFIGFTDIAFNPEKSFNCQARSCALVMSLLNREQLDESLISFDRFISVLEQYDPIHVTHSQYMQPTLLT